MTGKMFRIHAGRFIFCQPKYRSTDKTQFRLPYPLRSISQRQSISRSCCCLRGVSARFPSRPNKISVEQRGNEENAEALCDWSSIRMYLPANLRFRKNIRSKSQAGGRNDIRISSITYDALRANETALPRFLISALVSLGGKVPI